MAVTSIEATKRRKLLFGMLATALALAACGGPDNPTATPTQDSWEAFGVVIKDPVLDPHLNQHYYPVFVDPDRNTGDIANALFAEFNPQGDIQSRKSLAEYLHTQFPSLFEPQPNAHGNFDVLNTNSKTYLALNEQVISSIRIAATMVPPTPDIQATIRAYATAIATP